ncbi:putative non-specific serine/threonine protein kinase [Helianthus anomalus]
MGCLMVVGLWCFNPDSSEWPSIKQAICVLNFEGPLPCLPDKQPVPMYSIPPMAICRFMYTSSVILRRLGRKSS